MKRLILSLFVVAASAAFLMPAFGQQTFKFPIVCFEGDGLPKQLEEQFGEKPVAQGLDGRGFLFQVYRSEETFTILFIDPERNLTCMVGAGQEWMPVGDSY